MQHPLEGLAGQISFFTRNIAYNLDFIPDDKLDWKPAPTANSAMEIVHHLLMAHTRLGAVIAGTNPDEASVANPQTREEAKAALIESSDKYVAILRAVEPSTLGDLIEMRFAKLPKVFVCGMGIADTIHHHGQIAYLQTLLGDTESHFDMSLFGN
jgi:hypothetical protein